MIANHKPFFILLVRKIEAGFDNFRLYCSRPNVSLDIKPGSCPNPLNTQGSGNGKAVLPVAILGTDEFDVREIDPATILLEGVSPVRWSYEDVGTPVDKESDSCACTEEGADGYEDLTLKFVSFQHKVDTYEKALSRYIFLSVADRRRGVFSRIVADTYSSSFP